MSAGVFEIGARFSAPIEAELLLPFLAGGAAQMIETHSGKSSRTAKMPDTLY